MPPKVRTGPRGGKFTVDKYGNRTYFRKSSSRRGRTSTRGRRTITGRGGYFTDTVKTAVRKLSPGRRAGRWVDKAFGGNGKIGSSIGRFIGKIFGLGSYANSIKKNVFVHGMDVSSVTAAGPAKVENFKGHTIVTHREYIGDISGSVNFSNTSYQINPGNRTLFPWLSIIARAYEQYEWLGLVFEYRPTSVDALNSANTALGSVMMTTEYNSYNADYFTKQEFNNNDGTVSVKPSCGVMHPVECAPQETQTTLLSIRANPTEDGDKRLYDIGKFQIAVEGQQSGTDNILGELWVTYQVKMTKPTLENSITDECAFYTLSNASKNSPCSTSPQKEFDNIGITVATASPNLGTISTPAGLVGLYQLMYEIKGTAATIVMPAFTTSTGVLQDVTNLVDINLGVYGTAAAAQACFIIMKFYWADPSVYNDVDTVQIDASGATYPSSSTGQLIFQKVSNFLYINATSSTKDKLVKPSLNKSLRPYFDEKDTTMTEYEREFRNFMTDPKNSALTSDEKIALFKHLHTDDLEEKKEEEDDIEEINLDDLPDDLYLEEMKQRYDEITDLFSLSHSFDPDRYYPTLLDIDESFPDPKDYLLFLEWCGEAILDKHADNEVYDAQVARYLKLRKAAHLKTSIREKVKLTLETPKDFIKITQDEYKSIPNLDKINKECLEKIKK